MIDSIIRQFRIDGSLLSVSPYGAGHINDTYIAGFEQSGEITRYIFRKINSDIFKQPELLIKNTRRVLDQVRTKLKCEGVSDYQRRVMTMMMTHKSEPNLIDDNGDYWCCFLFIENSQSLDFIKKPEQAYEAAKAYGLFQKQIMDLDVSDFQPTIPDFHNIATRYKALEMAISSDAWQRATMAGQEINLILDRKNICIDFQELERSGALPLRITHNDTKLNNVLLDAETGEGICVIDLDTVMPGTVLFDFGDLVRSCTSPVAEDEMDLSKVMLRKNVFEALARGYLFHLKEILTQVEKAKLVFGARLITLIMGVRFLTDYLLGDIYYKTSGKEHNLSRCRNQLQLLRSIEEQSDELERIVDNI